MTQGQLNDLEVAYSNSDRFPYGLQLDDAGKAAIHREICIRFNEKSLRQLAIGLLTNGNENLWGQLTKQTEGKRINMNYSNAFEVALSAAVSSASNSNFGKDHQARLGIHFENDVQRVTRERRQKKREKDRARHRSEPATRTRMNKKRLKQYFVGSASKQDAYKSEKQMPDDLGSAEQKKQVSL